VAPDRRLLHGLRARLRRPDPRSAGQRERGSALPGGHRGRQLDAAWPAVAELLASPDTEKELLLAAIDAAAAIRPAQAPALLSELLDHADEDVVAAAHEALAMVEPGADEDDEDDGYLV
jgi:hypothetical protein